MIGKCKMCGWQAGIFNLKNGVCKACASKNVDLSDSLSQIEQMHHIEAGANAEQFSSFSFAGRITRSTFWTHMVLLSLIGGGLHIVFLLSSGRGGFKGPEVIGYSILYTPILYLVLTTSVKRLHDLDKSGWVAVTLFIPILNIMILFILGLAPGTEGPNRFGEELR
ncbi:MAG: DUF805 domain-containing protein [Nitrospirales bacterium]|nr:DUF805 domain-containing protein [Nitrospirales bacterium]